MTEIGTSNEISCSLKTFAFRRQTVSLFAPIEIHHHSRTIGFSQTCAAVVQATRYFERSMISSRWVTFAGRPLYALYSSHSALWSQSRRCKLCLCWNQTWDNYMIYSWTCIKRHLIKRSFPFSSRLYRFNCMNKHSFPFPFSVYRISQEFRDDCKL